jgi:hypothetical protein
LRLAFVRPSGKACDARLISAVGRGCLGKVDIVDDIASGYDFLCVIGIKNADLIKRMRQAGQPFLYFDKGYNRRWHVTRPDWWRVAVNGHQPTAYLPRLCFDAERAISQGWRAKSWRQTGNHIVFAGSSAKYHDFYGLDEPNAYAKRIIGQLRKLTKRRIVYRPKPSWRQAVAIDGSQFVNRARHSIRDDLRDAHALVTHGSAACLEAMLCGVPSIVLGDAIGAPISSNVLDSISRPHLASPEERDQLLANLAHCQWSLTEIERGEMWDSLNVMIETAHAL